jgi:hypothetical protein
VPVDLNSYAAEFDISFPEYGDGRYNRILSLVEAAFSNKGTVSAQIASPEFRNAMALLQPLIEIKNYKSQIPFPTDLSDMLSTLADLKSQVPDQHPLDNAVTSGIFERMVGVRGYDLPTVSAMFHFCHPNHFPIVDVNVEAACAYLKAKDNMERASPTLPSHVAKPSYKLARYADFIRFIDALIDARCIATSTERRLTYRFMDKALMVLGAKKLREKKEAKKERLARAALAGAAKK